MQQTHVIHTSWQKSDVPKNVTYVPYWVSLKTVKVSAFLSHLTLGWIIGFDSEVHSQPLYWYTGCPRSSCMNGIMSGIELDSPCYISYFLETLIKSKQFGISSKLIHSMVAEQWLFLPCRSKCKEWRLGASCKALQIRVNNIWF